MADRATMTGPATIAAVTVTAAVLTVATVALTSEWGVAHVWRPAGDVISDALRDVPDPPTEGGRTGE